MTLWIKVLAAGSGPVAAGRLPLAAETVDYQRFQNGGGVYREPGAAGP